MSTKRSNTPLLAGLAAAMVGLVALDRAGLLPGGDAAPDAPARGPRAAYEDRAAQHAQDAALLARAGEAQRLARDAGEAWNSLRASLVPGATQELAEARLRELAASVMADLSLLSPPRLSTVRLAAPAPAEPGASPSPEDASIRPIAIRVEFDAASSADAFVIIDRLENMPDVRSEVSQLSVSGPGRVQLPEQVSVSLTLRAAAHIGGGDS